MADKERLEVVKNTEWEAGIDDDNQGTFSARMLSDFLKRIRVWAFLSQKDVALSETMVSSKKLEEIEVLLNHQDPVRRSSAEAQAKKILGIDKEANEFVADKKNTTVDLFKDIITKGRLADTDFRVQISGNTYSIDELLLSDEKLGILEKASGKEIKQIFEKLEKLRDSGLPSHFNGVEASGFEIIEAKLRAFGSRLDYFDSEDKSELTGGKSAVNRVYGAEIDHIVKNDKDNLLIMNGKGKSKTLIEAVRDRFVSNLKNEVASNNAKEELKKLTGDQLIDRIKDTNELLANMGMIDGGKLNTLQRDQLRGILLSTRHHYEQAMADHLQREWNSKGKIIGKDAAFEAVRETLKSKRKRGSNKYEFDVDSKKEYLEFEKKSRVIAIKISAKEIGKSSVPSGLMGREMNGIMEDLDQMSELSMRNGNPANEEIYSKLMYEIGQLSMDPSYNIFEDSRFFHDLMSEDGSGIEAIITRSGAKNKDGFRDLLVGLRELRTNVAGLQGGEVSIMKDMMKYMSEEDYGAAVNLVLEYTARIGVQETSNDYKILFLMRQLMDRITKVSPDFADQFNKHKGLFYLPGVHGVKPEDFYSIQGKLMNKSSVDILFGEHALMTANLVDFGEIVNGKEELFSSKRVLSMLRSEKYQMMILNSEPNTIDSTLRAIMIEEMFGEGARIEFRTVDGEDHKKGFLVLADGTSHRMDTTMVKMRFADMAQTGFEGWKKKGHEVTLEEMFDRNQWVLRNGLQYMWFSGMWMDTLKSYPAGQMKNAPKSLATIGAAMVAYQANFENICPVFLEASAVLGDLLGSLERYKLPDIVGRTIRDALIKELSKKGLSESERAALLDRYTKLGELFTKKFSRISKKRIADKEYTIRNGVVSREMARLTNNNLSEMSSEIATTVQQFMKNRKARTEDIPSIAELQGYYQKLLTYKDRRDLRPMKINDSDTVEEKARKSAENREREKILFFGTQYESTWLMVKSRQFSDSETKLWSSLTEEELQVLRTMESKITGVDRKFTKDDFWKGIEIGAYTDWTSLKHGDDAEQYALKYGPAWLEARKSLLKIQGLQGTVEDYDNVYNFLSQFESSDEREMIYTILLDLQNLATSHSFTPYEVASTLPGTHRTQSIDWIKFTDTNGNTIYAEDKEGFRSYQKEMFSGNYAYKYYGKDMWRPHDIDLIVKRLHHLGLINHHQEQVMLERVLGTRRAVEYMAGKIAKRFNLKEEQIKPFIEWFSKYTSKAKVLSNKLFFVDDPWYAFWTLVDEFVGFAGKSAEHVTGIAVGGGGGKHGH